jgi:hypothetical protein
MKYWTKQNWEHWDRLVHCLSLATQVDASAAHSMPPPPIVAESPPPTEPEAVEVDLPTEPVAETETVTELESGPEPESSVEEPLPDVTPDAELSPEPEAAEETEASILEELVSQPEASEEEISKELESDQAEDEALRQAMAERDAQNVASESSTPSEDQAKSLISGLFPSAETEPSSESEPTEPQSPDESPAGSTSLPQAQALPISKIAKTFFHSIPWGQSFGAEAAGSVSDPSVSPETARRTRIADEHDRKVVPFRHELSAKASDFFGALPWAGEFQFGEGDEEIMRISVGTQATDAGRNIRSADDVPAGNLLAAGMLSAARTSDRMLVSGGEPIPLESVSREYFEAIPW